MPQFVIENEKSPKAVPPITLRLARGHNGSVRVVTGDGWYLVEFKTNGTLSLEGSVPSALGFQLDDRKRLVIEDD